MEKTGVVDADEHVGTTDLSIDGDAKWSEDTIDMHTNGRPVVRVSITETLQNGPFRLVLGQQRDVQLVETKVGQVHRELEETGGTGFGKQRRDQTSAWISH